MAYFIPLHVLTSTTCTVSTNKVFLKLWLTSYCINQQFVLLPNVTFLKYIHADSYRLPLFEMPIISYVEFLYLLSSQFLRSSYFLLRSSFLDLTTCILLSYLFWSTDIFSPTLKPCYFNYNIINVDIWKAPLLSHNCPGHS